VWGVNLVGTGDAANPANIVWGVVSEPAETVWQRLDASNIVWGVAGGQNIVWGVNDADQTGGEW
jgi:hypothetical protein